jgi:hypothetical protein
MRVKTQHIHVKQHAKIFVANSEFPPFVVIHHSSPRLSIEELPNVLVKRGQFTKRSLTLLDPLPMFNRLRRI